MNTVGIRTFCQMTAVVICFDEALGVVGVDVESVEVGADALDWGEVLYGAVSVIAMLRYIASMLCERESTSPESCLHLPLRPCSWWCAHPRLRLDAALSCW